MKKSSQTVVRRSNIDHCGHESANVVGGTGCMQAPLSWLVSFASCPVDLPSDCMFPTGGGPDDPVEMPLGTEVAPWPLTLEEASGGALRGIQARLG